MPNALRTILTWVLVVALFAAAATIFIRWDLPHMRRIAAPVGQHAPNVRFVRLNGSPTSLAAYGGRPLWINFFATWCVPCKAELPEIQRRYMANHGRGLVVLGADQEEQAPLVADFAKRMGLTFPVVIDKGEGTIAYHVSAIPSSVFVDPNGTIRFQYRGQMPPKLMDEALAKILP